jgi:hypothetical protein
MYVEGTGLCQCVVVSTFEENHEKLFWTVDLRTNAALRDSHESLCSMRAILSLSKTLTGVTLFLSTIVAEFLFCPFWGGGGEGADFEPTLISVTVSGSRVNPLQSGYS